MGRPILFDTDMGVDDAVALSLALSSESLDVVGIASVGGNVDVEQATTNIERLLAALGVADRPRVARGHDQAEDGLQDATHVFGADGFGDADIAPAEGGPCEAVESLYEDLLSQHAGSLVIVAVGPLTNLAAVQRRHPDLLAKAARIVVMGGAVWCRGNVTPHAEFNFYRDPQAAADLLRCGVPTTLVPLDVTRQVAMDESHVAHLLACGTRAGDVLGQMIPSVMRRGRGAEAGRFVVHDAVAVGALLWPAMFMQTTLAIDVRTDAQQRGRCVPVIGRSAEHAVSVLVSIRSVDFLENLLESLCLERFVV